MNPKEQKLLSMLQHEWDLLEASAATLSLSIKKCRRIGIKKDYSFNELESLDSLTSKFARSSDIFTQKIIKTVSFLLREERGTFIDRMNAAEKYEIIVSAEEMIAIRDLRNQIAHEYVQEKIEELFQEVLEYGERLIKNIEKTRVFIQEKFPPLCS